MDWTAPIALTYPPETTPWQKLVMFIGHHDCRVYLTAGSYIDVGAGSLPCILNIVHVPPGEVGSIGSIGRFCEFGPTSQVMSRGEHANDQPVNISFTGLPVMGPHFEALGLMPMRPIEIGSGVVISAGARVMTGVSIGDGAVIGASAVVTRAAEPFGIYAGVPARKLRERPTFAPWWDFDIAYMMANRDRLQELAASDDPHVYRKPRPKFALRNDGPAMNVIGFVDNDQLHPLTEAPAQVRDYVAQVAGPSPNNWLADCWPD